MAVSVYHIDVRKSNNTKYKKSNQKKNVYGTDLDDKRKICVPIYFIFDIRYFNKEYLIVKDKEGVLNIYFTPLIRTLLNDLNKNSI